MGIQYLWHDHPLEPRSVLSDAGAECYVCKKPVSSYSYKCSKCNFFLHISCLKLPLESVHPLHQDHPLTLLSEPPLDPQNHEIPCNKCKDPCSGFTYYCIICSFSLDLHCSTEQYNLSFEVHKHPLTFSAWPPNGFESFICNMCGEYGFGFCFFCKICQFVVHVECSALPAKVRYGFYERVLDLISVQSIEDGTGEFYCSVCEERVNVKGSIYYCADSEYIGHLGCMVSTSELHFKPAYTDVKVSSCDLYDAQRLDTIANNQLIIPLGKDDDEELARMRKRFRELVFGNDMQLTDPLSSESKQSIKKLDHFSHEHPLIFCDDYQSDTFRCYACWGLISRFAYGCSKCTFFLHKWCAELPQKVQHPMQPEHSLSLLSNRPSFCYGCDACGHTLEGFTYTCKPCYFNLHAICASIPSIIKNEIHQHPLIQCRKRPYSSKCSCCKDDCIGIVFECEMCNLVLDFKCALLPRKIKHNCHIDPLTLTSLVEDEDEYYCHACEERREPNHWVYYCAGCEFSAHLSCVVSELVGAPDKEGPVRFDYHEHLLDLITKI